MSRSTISEYQLFQMFPDQGSGPYLHGAEALAGRRTVSTLPGR